MLIKKNDIVLFQGDSITDAGRKYENPADLGWGYAGLAASWFSASHPEMPVTFLNRGISGHRTSDLKQRWARDCLDLHPTVVSLMIGINDTWRRYDSHDPMPIADFKENYCYLMEQIRSKLNCRIILLEPFALPYPEDRKAWREDLDPKIAAVKKISREYKTVLVPLDAIMNRVFLLKKPDFWAEDGVHPTMAGHALIAREWLKAARAL